MDIMDFLFDNFIYVQKKTSQKPKEIYASQKGSDSPGSF